MLFRYHVYTLVLYNQVCCIWLFSIGSFKYLSISSFVKKIRKWLVNEHRCVFILPHSVCCTYF